VAGWLNATGRCNDDWKKEVTSRLEGKDRTGPGSRGSGAGVQRRDDVGRVI
jgi:hypothetical protein